MNKLEKDILNSELRLDTSILAEDGKETLTSTALNEASDTVAEDEKEAADASLSATDMSEDDAGIQLKIDDEFFSEISDGSYDSERDQVSLDMSSVSEELSPDEASESSNANDPHKLYEDTMELVAAKDLEVDTAITLLKKSADEGEALACLSLGQLYSDSDGLVYNPTLAFEYISKAAALDSGSGYYNLGLCYSRGFGCEKDEARAAECFKSGAAMYDPDSICALGICYEHGIGEEINYEYAVTLYQKGYELGHGISANNLGGCYFYGHGVAQDKSRAIEMFKRATELGCSDAECRLGVCCELGDGCKGDPVRAFEYYRSAAKKRNAFALYRLGRCYYRGIGTEQNFNKAYKYYFKSAALGYAPAKYRAGRMCISGRGTKKDFGLAFKYFSSAARDGYAPAEYSVANCFFEGLGTLRNFTNAYIHYTKVYESQGGDRSDAAFRIGLCHLKGLGVKKDVQEAYEWFLSGARLGSPEAMYMLGECYLFGVGTAANDESAANSFTCAMELYEKNEEEKEQNIPLMLALAQCFEHGMGTEKDAERALATYKSAAQSGNPEALFRLGQAIMQGVGMRAEYATARSYILRSARAGFLPAMLAMGVFSEEGKGVKKNKSDAVSWYLRAVSSDTEPQQSLFDFPERYAESVKICNESKIKAEYKLGMLMARYNVSAQNYIAAFEYIAEAASAGYEPAQTEIAKIHISGGDLREYYESPFSATDACFEGGEAAPDKDILAEALCRLGDSFFDGKHLLKKNEAAAARCYRYSAELGNTDACYSYGWCLRHGVGVRGNDAESVKWLKMAADRGNGNAAYSYGLCCEEGCGTGVRNMHDALYYYRMAALAGHDDAAQRYKILSSGEE